MKDRKVNKNLCYDGRKSFVTWQIVILKIKIKLVSINAAANCNQMEACWRSNLSERLTHVEQRDSQKPFAFPLKT